jgi:hypothetical protein
MSDEGPKRPDDEAKDRERGADGDADTEDRALILARRGMLIASALAGLAVTTEGCDALERRVSPQPCLSPMPPRDDRLVPCLQPALTEGLPDGGDVDARAAMIEGADASAPPTPCLKVRATPLDARGLLRGVNPRSEPLRELLGTPRKRTPDEE